MTQLTFKRVNTLPASKDPNTLYLVKGNEADEVNIHITGTTGGDVRHILTHAEVVALLSAGNGIVAETLKTARKINGISFDGGADITINAVDSTSRVASSEKGAVNGVCELDGAGLVPSNRLPSYVDDVLEYADQASLPATGSTGKIYVTLDTNKIYRWSGSAYINIPTSPGSTDVVTEGTTNLYFTVARVRAAVLTGISFVTKTAVTAADSILVAIGKLQAQISDHTTATGNVHGATAADIGAQPAFIKVTVLPGTFTANAIYIVQPAGDTQSQMWVASSDGTTVSRIGGDDDLDPFLLMGLK